MSGRRGRAPGATIHDVAQRAGVSLMTVSRVTNAAAGVAPATRARVQQAIAQLGFVPSGAARSLRSRRSMWIALVFQRARTEIKVDPGYVMELQEGVIRRCMDDGYHVAIELLGADAGEARLQLRALSQQLAPDGVLLAPPLSSATTLHGEIARLNLPCVRIAPRSATGNTPCVLMDDRAAARQMTEYLLSHGHRRIAFVTGPAEHAASAQRLAGYRAALRAWSVAEHPGLVVDGDFTFDGGRQAAGAVLGSGRQAPTAIFASNDEMAAGCLAEAHRRGLRVPADLSVTGFDDTWIANKLYPPLTTIRQPIREMGHAATGQLLALIEGLAPKQTQRFTHQLIERQSAAARRIRR